MDRLCVFSGSSPGAHPDYAEAARELGRSLAERGIGLVYGGAHVGLMGVLADSALESGGEVVGVIPQALVEREIAHPGVSDLRVVGTMHERKALMADLADGFIALPGGTGTLDELFEVYTWTQLGLHSKPLGLLDVRGYYAQLAAFLDHAVQERFLTAEHRGDAPGRAAGRGADRRVPGLASAGAHEVDRPLGDMTTLHTLRVFLGPDGGGGNPLGVILDGAAVPPDRRQAIAADLGFSETVFVDDAATGALRIFTPAVELPLAGHPLVGTSWLLAHAGTAVGVLRPPAGDVPTWVEGELTWIRAREEWARMYDVAAAGDARRTSTRSPSPAATRYSPSGRGRTRPPAGYARVCSRTASGSRRTRRPAPQRSSSAR